MVEVIKLVITTGVRDTAGVRTYACTHARTHMHTHTHTHTHTPVCNVVNQLWGAGHNSVELGEAVKCL